MKLNTLSSLSFVWIACSVYTLFITALILWVNSLYGLEGISILLFLSIALLQPYKIIYEWCAVKKEYNKKLVKSITNCWIIYLILDIALCTSWLFSVVILMAVNSIGGISQSIYCLIILAMAVILTIKPIQPFVRKEILNEDGESSTKLISAFVPRFVILYTFAVYYFISFSGFSSINEIIPSLCVLYIGIERIITMFNTVREYSESEYKYLFRDTAWWIKKRRNME